MILIVDDNPHNIVPLQKILQLNNFASDTAESGEMALRMILKNTYSLIIMDVQMPGMDGFEVAEAMAGYSKVKNTPIIFLSAVNKNKDFVTKGYLSGGIDYITKPVDPDILMLKVKTFHKIYEQQKKLRESEDLLKAEIGIRKKTELALASFNNSLEQKVEARTVELQAKNEVLEGMNQELQQFTWVVSHDLIEPLRKIQTFNGILKDRFLSEDNNAREYLDRSISAAARMSDLIRDLLHYSRLSVKTEYKLTNLNDVVKELIEDFDHVTREKNAIFRVDDLPQIASIPGQMRQVFQNLIGNSLKFTVNGRDPVITITAERIREKSINSKPQYDGDYCRILVKDNGIGFDKQYCKKIFIIFQRLQKLEDYEGTGIGLAIAKKIVDKHNGLIAGQSVENEGSTFILVLPISQPNDQ